MKKWINAVIVFCINLFIPFLYVAFLLAAGTGSALVSAIIEYEVVTGLFPKGTALIPLLMVCAFEIGKVFLIFLRKQYKMADYSAANKNIFLGLSTVLIVISFAATLLYSFYNLHNPEYDSQLVKATQQIEKAHGQDVQDVNQRYNQHVRRTEENCEREKNRIWEQYQQEIDRWNERMKEEERFKDEHGSFRGSRYQTFENHYNQTKTQRDQAISKINCKVDSLIETQQAKIEELNAVKTSAITAARDTLHGSMAAGNKFVAAALMVIHNVQSEKDYPRSAYTKWIFWLSLLLSTGLELIIYSAFTILSANHGATFASGFEKTELKEKYKEALDTIEEYEKMKTEAHHKRVVNERKAIENTLDQFDNS